MDIIFFLRENGVTHYSEANAYYVIKFFDSDEDGKLHYPDFLQVLLPCTNAKIRSEATQRPQYEVRPHDFLPIDIEQDLSRLIKAELQNHID